MALVVDASVAIGWLLPAQATSYTRHVLERVKREQIVVPVLWSIEVVNVLLVRRRRGALSATQADALLHRLERLKIAVDSYPLSSAVIFALGEEHGLSSYDATYLELAQRRGLPLATRDTLLQRAARAAGVTLV